MAHSSTERRSIASHSPAVRRMAAACAFAGGGSRRSGAGARAAHAAARVASAARAPSASSHAAARSAHPATKSISDAVAGTRHRGQLDGTGGWPSTGAACISQCCARHDEQKR